MKKIVFVFTLVLSMFIVGCKQTSSSPEVTVINPVEFEEKISSVPSYQLIDVRTAEEYSDGHLPNAINIDFYGEDFKDEISKLDRNKPTFVYCRKGKRSEESAKILEELGFKEIYDLEGGILNWQKDELPMEQ